MINALIAFNGVLTLQEKDERFVLREEFIDNNREIYHKIDENDKRHTSELKDLNNKVDKQIIYQNKHLKVKNAQKNIWKNSQIQ